MSLCCLPFMSLPVCHLAYLPLPVTAVCNKNVSVHARGAIFLGVMGVLNFVRKALSLIPCYTWSCGQQIWLHPESSLFFQLLSSTCTQNLTHSPMKIILSVSGTHSLARVSNIVLETFPKFPIATPPPPRASWAKACRGKDATILISPSPLGLSLQPNSVTKQKLHGYPWAHMALVWVWWEHNEGMGWMCTLTISWPNASYGRKSFSPISTKLNHLGLHTQYNFC